MTWSFAQARHAAWQIRTAPSGRQAAATARPRSVLGVVRARAPLALLLYLAGRDGRVVTQDGGFAVLARPAIDPPVTTGGPGLRLLRRVDRHWDTLVYAGPPALALLVAVATALPPATRVVALVAALAAMLWVCAFLTTMAGYQVWSLARMGAAGTPRRSRAVESLPAYHWSVPLLHQPDPGRVDDLLALLTERLTDLIHADLQTAAGDRARVARPDVTETLLVLTSGVTSDAARVAVTESLRAAQHGMPDNGVVVLASPGRLERAPRRPLVGGSFLLLYLTGLALVVAVLAVPVADAEAQACAATSCDGRPVTYPDAVRWLLQRLLLSDPADLSPATVWVSVLGWLVSLAALTGLGVAYVAGRQEIARNKQTHLDHKQVMETMTKPTRVLILVVTEGERDAVRDAVRRHVGRAGVLDYAGERTVHRLGVVGGSEIMLAQAGEQGTAAAAGMMFTARAVIEQVRPDYVVLTGICYGLHPDEGQQLGDVVVARRVQNVDHRKVVDGKPVRYRGVNVGCSPGLLDRFQAAQASWVGARVHFGTVLTSNTLVDSRHLVAQLRKDFPDAIAGEMEGTGVHEAATLGVKPDWIMIKAISDWGHDKTKDAQPLAARNAAEFVTHALADRALRHRRHGAA